jgi:SulP family sulfate permease
VHIDLSQAHFWDISAVDTLDKLVICLQREGIDVKVLGLSSESRTLIDRFSIYDQRDIDLLD